MLEWSIVSFPTAQESVDFPPVFIPRPAFSFANLLTVFVIRGCVNEDNTTIPATQLRAPDSLNHYSLIARH